MKKLLLPVSVLITFSYVAQGYLSEKVIYFDENGTPVKKKEAARLQQTIQLNDTLWETNLYNVNRSLVHLYAIAVRRQGDRRTILFRW